MQKFRWLSRRGGALELTSRRSYLLLSACFVLFGAAVALLSSFIHYRMHSTSIDASIRDRFLLHQSEKLGQFSRRVVELDAKASALAENPLMTEYLVAPSPERLEALQYLFTLVALSHEELMQVRYIDRSGMERVRVDRIRAESRPRVVEQGQLQDKSHRYYFNETRDLPPEHHWHSRLDLNREQGKLERPLRPTFRVATPVYLGSFFAGIVILNTEAEAMLTELARAPDFNVYLVDADGEVLINPSRQLSWSRYLDQRPSLRQLMPGAADTLLAGGTPQGAHLYSFSIDGVMRNGEGLRVVMEPKSEMLDEMMADNTLAALFIAGSVIFISLPLAWLAAVIPARLQRRLQDTLSQLGSSSAQLDRHVISCRADRRGRITHASSAFCDVSGYALWELKGHTHKLLRHPDTPGAFYREIAQTLKLGRSWRGELKQLSRSGDTFWVNTVLTPEMDAAGEVVGFSEVSADVTDRKALEKMSVTDELTGVCNRRRLDQLLDGEMERYLRYRQHFSVILLDLDRFKSVNDTEGHQAGDAVLAQVAQCLGEQLRRGDYLGRWGGEEFLVICPGTDEAGAGRLAEKLRDGVERLPQPVGRRVTASLGVAQARPAEKLNQLITRVDAALYRAKREGRNRVVRSQGRLAEPE